MEMSIQGAEKEGDDSSDGNISDDSIFNESDNDGGGFSSSMVGQKRTYN